MLRPASSVLGGPTIITKIKEMLQRRHAGASVVPANQFRQLAEFAAIRRASSLGEHSLAAGRRPVLRRSKAVGNVV
jgi:hypothetical protein